MRYPLSKGNPQDLDRDIHHWKDSTKSPNPARDWAHQHQEYKAVANGAARLTASAKTPEQHRQAASQHETAGKLATALLGADSDPAKKHSRLAEHHRKASGPLAKTDPSKPAKPPSGKVQNKPAKPPAALKAPTTALPKPPPTPAVPKPPKAATTRSVSVTRSVGGVGMGKAERPRRLNEKDIVHEAGDFWVADRGKGEYHVNESGPTHSTKVGTYHFPDKPEYAKTRAIANAEERAAAKRPSSLGKSESDHVREYALPLNMGGLRRWHAGCLAKDDSKHGRAAKSAGTAKTYSRSAAATLGGTCTGCGGELSLDPGGKRSYSNKQQIDGHDDQKVETMKKNEVLSKAAKQAEIGKTRSGKLVYGPSKEYLSADRQFAGAVRAHGHHHPEIDRAGEASQAQHVAHMKLHTGFTAEDHEDAAKLHQPLANSSEAGAGTRGDAHHSIAETHRVAAQKMRTGGKPHWEESAVQTVKSEPDTSKYLNGARLHYHHLVEAQRLNKSAATVQRHARLVSSYLRLAGFDPAEGVPDAVKNPAGVDLSKSSYQLDRTITMLPLVKAVGGGLHPDNRLKYAEEKATNSSQIARDSNDPVHHDNAAHWSSKAAGVAREQGKAALAGYHESVAAFHASKGMKADHLKKADTSAAQAAEAHSEKANRTNSPEDHGMAARAHAGAAWRLSQAGDAEGAAHHNARYAEHYDKATAGGHRIQGLRRPTDKDRQAVQKTLSTTDSTLEMAEKHLAKAGGNADAYAKSHAAKQASIQAHGASSAHNNPTELGHLHAAAGAAHRTAGEAWEAKGNAELARDHYRQASEHMKAAHGPQKDSTPDWNKRPVAAQPADSSELSRQNSETYQAAQRAKLGKSESQENDMAQLNKAHAHIQATLQKSIGDDSLEKGPRGPRPPKPHNEDAVRELHMFADNDGDLYRQQASLIHANLANKMAAGKYDHEKAKKLFGYLADNAAKKYQQQFGSSGSQDAQIFTPADRREVAGRMADEFRQEAGTGNYDNHLQLQYKKKGVTLKDHPATQAPEPAHYNKP